MIPKHTKPLSPGNRKILTHLCSVSLIALTCISLLMGASCIPSGPPPATGNSLTITINFVAFGSDPTANFTGVFSGTLSGSGSGPGATTFSGSTPPTPETLTTDPSSPPNAFLSQTFPNLQKGTWTIKAQVQGVTAVATCNATVPGAANITFDASGVKCQ